METYVHVIGFGFLRANHTYYLGVIVSVLYQNAGNEPAQTKFPPSGKRNVIFMVSDGTPAARALEALCVGTNDNWTQAWGRRPFTLRGPGDNTEMIYPMMIPCFSTNISSEPPEPDPRTLW